MAGLYNLMILGVMLIGVVVGVEGVTDQQFQELSNFVEQSQNKNDKHFGDLERLVRDQAKWIQEQSSVISHLTETNSQLFSELVNVKLFCGMKAPEQIGHPDESEIIQNATVEERVALLEIQVVEIEEDISDLDQDVNFLFDEQVIQDERLFQLETETGEIQEDIVALQAHALDLEVRVGNLEESGGSDGNSSISELEERVETLEGTVTIHGNDIEDLEGITGDHETRLTAAEENIQGLQMTDINHNARITSLEENGGGGSGGNASVAFHAVIDSAPTVTVGSNVEFDIVLLNVGEGYDGTTGIFTVPPGADGLYYFSTYLTMNLDLCVHMDIQVNDVSVCSARGDQQDTSLDTSHATCYAVADVAAGDEVKVAYMFASPGTSVPLYSYSTYKDSGFTGFKI